MHKSYYIAFFLFILSNNIYSDKPFLLATFPRSGSRFLSEMIAESNQGFFCF